MQQVIRHVSPIHLRHFDIRNNQLRRKGDP
jgi:hypothetical protein